MISFSIPNNSGSKQEQDLDDEFEIGSSFPFLFGAAHVFFQQVTLDVAVQRWVAVPFEEPQKEPGRAGSVVLHLSCKFGVEGHLRDGSPQFVARVLGV